MNSLKVVAVFQKLRFHAGASVVRNSSLQSIMNKETWHVGANKIDASQFWRPTSTEAACLEGDAATMALDNGPERYSQPVEVDAPLLNFLKGQRQKIEEEADVILTFPNSKKETNVVIEGNSSENVSKASDMVKNVLEQAVDDRSIQYSHFISLPLAIHPDLVEKLYHFQKSVLGEVSFNENIVVENEDKQEGNYTSKAKPIGEDKYGGVNMDRQASTSGSKLLTLSELNIDKSIFIRPPALHLTVLMLKLWNKDRVAAAAEVLQLVSAKVKDALANRPIYIRLSGLTLMKGTPARAKVLYAPVLEVGGEGRLLRACKVITDAFVEAGLLDKVEAKRELKLHATVMNTSHRRTKDRRRPRDDFFDARHILSVHGKHEWGQYRLGEVHLSERFKYDDNGYYHCCSSFPLPEDMNAE